MNLEDYIKELSPELQEKARACGSVDELLVLAKENKIPLPDEALTAIAGGQDGGTVNCGKLHCPQCSCTKIAYQYEDRGNYYQYFYTCTGCGYEWSERWPKSPDPGINEDNHALPLETRLQPAWMAVQSVRSRAGRLVYAHQFVSGRVQRVGALRWGNRLRGR